MFTDPWWTARQFALCRHITPSADIGSVDPNADGCLQRRPRTILRPRPPHITAGLAFIGRIAFRSADPRHLIARVGDLLADPTQRRTRTRILGPHALAGGRFRGVRLRRCWRRCCGEHSNAATAAPKIRVFMELLLDLRLPRAALCWSRRCALRSSASGRLRPANDQGKVFGGWGSVRTDRPSIDGVEGHAEDPTSIIAFATTGCLISSVNGMAHPIPAMQASVIRSQGIELSPLSCIMPTQSIGIAGGAVDSIAATMGLAETTTVCPRRPSKAAMTSTILSARPIGIFSASRRRPSSWEAGWICGANGGPFRSDSGAATSGFIGGLQQTSHISILHHAPRPLVQTLAIALCSFSTYPWEDVSAATGVREHVQAARSTVETTYFFGGFSGVPG